jgi:hypothetical protein
MNRKPDWLIEKQFQLPNGDVALWSYDTEGDLLEITFQQRAASATIELTDGIFLRFARKAKLPLSLSIVSVTPLMRQREFGLPLLTLTGLSKLSASEQHLIVEMLQTPPLNAILKLYSFKPKPRARVIPVASFTHPLAMMA